MPYLILSTISQFFFGSKEGIFFDPISSKLSFKRILQDNVLDELGEMDKIGPHVLTFLRGRVRGPVQGVAVPESIRGPLSCMNRHTDRQAHMIKKCKVPP